MRRYQYDVPDNSFRSNDTNSKSNSVIDRTIGLSVIIFEKKNGPAGLYQRANYNCISVFLFLSSFLTGAEKRFRHKCFTTRKVPRKLHLELCLCDQLQLRLAHFYCRSAVGKQTKHRTEICRSSLLELIAEIRIFISAIGRI